MLDGRQMRCLSVISSLKKPRTFQMDDALFNYFFSSSAWHRLKNQLARKTQNTFNYFFQQTLQPPVYRKTSKTRMTLYPWPPTLHTSLPRIPELHPPFLQSPPRGIWLHFSCWVQFIRDHGDGHLKADKIFRSFIEAAEELGQEATPPVTTLEDAYQVYLQGGEQKLARKIDKCTESCTQD